MQNGTTRHKGKQKETQAGRQAGKQGRRGLGKKDTPSNKGKQEGRQAGRQEGRQDGRQAGDKGDKALGRRTHHPTKGDKKGEKLGDKGEGGHTHTHPTKGIKKEDKLGDKMGDKASGRRTHHPIKWETRYGGGADRKLGRWRHAWKHIAHAAAAHTGKSLQKPLPPSFSNSVWWRGPTWLVQLSDDVRSRQLPRPSSERDPSLIFSLRLSVRQTRRGPEAQHHHLYYFVSCYSHAPHGHLPFALCLATLPPTTAVRFFRALCNLGFSSQVRAYWKFVQQFFFFRVE